MISQQGQLNKCWCRIQGSRQVAVIAGQKDYHTLRVNPVSDIVFVDVNVRFISRLSPLPKLFSIKIRLAIWS
jgi:hypothetical protein